MKYCIEVDIGLLALDSICASDELKNIDNEASKLEEKGYRKILLIKKIIKKGNR